MAYHPVGSARQFSPTVFEGVMYGLALSLLCWVLIALALWSL